jgi:SEC-C motif
MSGQLGRNDLCWCGSGLKFKRCHLARVDASRLAPGQIEALIGYHRAARRCMHPQASRGACNHIIDAHTIQRSRVLSALVDDTNHVLTLSLRNRDENDLPVLSPTGWREASTFTGFCQTHDSTTFAPLEKEEWTASREQCFLLAYRALCYELYQKHHVLSKWPALRSVADRGMPEVVQRSTQAALGAQHLGLDAGVRALEELKAHADDSLHSRDFSRWNNLVLTYEGPVGLALAGAVSPNRDFDGHAIQVLHDPEAPREYLYWGSQVTSSGGVIVLVWRASDAAARRFIDSLQSREPAIAARLLVQYAFLHISNTYFSREFWDSLPLSSQTHLRSLAGELHPYYSAVLYDTAMPLPWHHITLSISAAA